MDSLPINIKGATVRYLLIRLNTCKIWCFNSEFEWSSHMLIKMSAHGKGTKTHQLQGQSRRIPWEMHQSLWVWIKLKFFIFLNSALVQSKNDLKATVEPISTHILGSFSARSLFFFFSFCSSGKQSTCISKDVSFPINFPGHTPHVLKNVKTLTTRIEFSAAMSGWLWGCNTDQIWHEKKKGQGHEKRKSKLMWRVAKINKFFSSINKKCNYLQCFNLYFQEKNTKESFQYCPGNIREMN